MSVAKWFESQPIRRKLLLAAVFPVLVLVLISALAYRSVNAFEQAEDLLTHTYQSRAATFEYLRLVVDLETGFRGFVLTKQDRFLQPYEEAKERIGPLGEVLRGMVHTQRDAHAQLSLLKEIEALVQRLIREKNELIERVRAGKAVDALHYIEEGRGRDLMQSIRGLIVDFDRVQIEHLNTAREEAALDRFFLLTVIVGGGVVVLTALVLLLQLIATSIASPLASLVDTVKHTASGQIPILPVFERNDEIGELTHAMQAMRQQIQHHIDRLEKSEADLRVLYQDLSASEAKYRDLVNHAPLGIYTIKDGAIAFSNRYNQALAGLNPDEQPDPNAFWQAIHPEDRGRVQKELASTMEEARPFESVFRLRLPNGAIRKILSRAVSVQDASVQPSLYQGFNVDITAREHTQEEASRAKRLATLGQVAAGIAHEIRNPLVGIGSTLSVIFEDMELSDPRRADFALVFNEIKRLDRIVRQVVEYARPRPLAPELLSIGDVLRDSLSWLEDGLVAKSVQLEVRVPLELPKVEADRDQLKQVLLNVVQNAVEALGQGGRLTLSASEALRDDTPGVLIEIGDNGVGIPASDLPHVLEPFFTTGKRSGTGLGLAICRNIVEGHAGQIQVTSALGKGSTVSLWLPLRQPVERSER